jgi:hypothetical protein
VDLNGDHVVNNFDVRLRIQQTALDLGAAGRDASYGFGRIRADLAATNCAVAPPPVSAPEAPDGLTAPSVTRTSVSLAWNDKSNNETNFEVWRCTGSCTSFGLVATLPAGAVTYTNSGLRRNTTYGYKVRATNGSGPSPFSNTVYPKTLP